MLWGRAESVERLALIFVLAIKINHLRVVPHPALALDNKTSNAIISVGPKPHYI